MHALLDNILWTKARNWRKWQKLFGRVSGLFLAVGLLALFDGLLAQMRAGSSELDLVRGQEVVISGPAVLKNPVSSDLLPRFEPVSAPLVFELEGFFSGYWFGNGMWRGKVKALPDADTGQYELSISFRGASAQTRQTYIFKVFASGAQMQAAALSLCKRFLGINPFAIAAVCGVAGMFLGLITYYFGRRYAICLKRLGLAQIYRFREDDGSLWCMARGMEIPQKGNVRMIIKENGQLLGEASAVECNNGKICLKMLDGKNVSPTDLVCLVPPDIANNRE